MQLEMKEASVNWPEDNGKTIGAVSSAHLRTAFAKLEGHNKS